MINRKMLAVLAALTMMFAPLSAGILSAQAATSGNYEYEPVHGFPYYTGVILTKYNWDADALAQDSSLEERIEIPEEIDGEEVEGIGDGAYMDHPNMKEVIIPESVISIGDRAFYREDITPLVITIPESVEYIGEDIVYAAEGEKPWEKQHRIEMAVTEWMFEQKYQLRLHERYPGDHPMTKEMELYQQLDQEQFSMNGELRTLDGREVDFSELGIELLGMPNGISTIRGYSGSYAEIYANENNIPFESIGEASVTASTFNGGYIALAGIGGLALGIAGTVAVMMPKKKKEA
ncbi:MAG: leucine-rich repeat protein [Oscillospiraceae bacterium]|nr:leucine-rich repeat protein [Oscillospiraceae bacterium]